MKSSSRARRWLSFLALCVVILAISRCASQPLPAAAGVPGFWMGLVHGFLIFFSFVGSLFLDVRIYAFPNSGGWYDFGYLLGASAFLGGGGAAA